MNPFPPPRPPRFPSAIACLALLLFLPACRPPRTDAVQGYIEGDYVYVASPLAGQLATLAVRRGAQVRAGDPLFSLESGAETAARALAARRLDEGRSTLADARKGRRKFELDALEAHLGQSRAALAVSEKEFARQTDLARSGAAAAQDLDRARGARDQDRQRVAQAESDLATARLGQRDDQIAAMEAAVHGLEAALAKADWDLAQKQQNAPRSGLVFDTLYRAGEWVAAGRPVVALLPPENLKLRAFVPETRVGSIHPGDAVRVTVDGTDTPAAGHVSFVSPRAEYTPPVIYSRESRGKLVFMVEAEFPPEVAARLHPGQPVDVRFGP